MKPQEAIETIKIAIAEVEWEYPMDYAAAFEEAIKALEKQIPKKPTKYGIDYSGNSLFRCPVCGDSWNSNEFGDGIEHCWTCGQAIDWSEEDE